MSVSIFIDPTPVPLKIAAERMKMTEDLLVIKHLSGEYPVLRRIGKRWFWDPLKAVKLATEEDGDEERQPMASELHAPGNGGAKVHEGRDGRGGRGTKARRTKEAASQEWANPLD